MCGLNPSFVVFNVDGITNGHMASFPQPNMDAHDG